MIQFAENDLTNVIEAELKMELENFKKFETLNAERITPHFMSMVKGSNKSEKPTLIRNDDGTVFESINDQKNYVGSYYKKIYKKNPDLLISNDSENIKYFQFFGWGNTFTARGRWCKIKQ